MTPSLRTQRLSRKPAQRKQLVRNLVTSLLLYESIRTTETRAKVIQPLIEKMITKAKSQPPHLAVRSMNRIVTDKNASRKMFEVIVPMFQNRSSGFTRIRSLGRRIGDGAKLVEISLVSDDATTDTGALSQAKS